MDDENLAYARLKPEEAIGIPLAEVDQSVIEDTYCVISQSWGQTYVHRYSRLPTLSLFDPYSSARRAVIACTTHVCYDICMITIVFLNLIDLAMPDSMPLLILRSTLLFYIAEMVYETIAKGFIFGSYAYLKNPWMCLDFIITLLSLSDLETNTDTKFGIQSLRGIRILNLISKIPGVQKMAQAIILSMFRMYGVALIMILFLLSVTLAAKQLFMGIFRRRCVKNFPLDFEASNISYIDFINDETNWDVDEHNEYIMCGNYSGSQKCGANYSCLLTRNSLETDITSFDTFSLSLINSFRLLTQDEWESIYDKTIEATGPLCILFFLPVIFVGSFFLLNLMLVVVTSTFDSIMMSGNDKKNLHCYKYHSTFQFDIKQLALYPLPTSAKELKRVFRERDEIIASNRLLKKMWKKIIHKISLKLHVHNTNDQRKNQDQNSLSAWTKFRRNIRKVSDSKPFHYFCLLVIIINTVLLASEHARMSEGFIHVLDSCNMVITGIFFVEILINLIAYGKKYFLNWWKFLDFLIIMQSVISMTFNIFAGYSIFRSLRLLELLRVQQVWPALQRVISIILSSMRNIMKLLFVMLLVVFIFAVIGNRVLGQLLREDAEVSRGSFATFGRSLFLVFEIFAGEWFEPLFTCLVSTKFPLLCVTIIIPYYVMGFLVIINVFTAVLLGAFDASALKLPKLRTPTDHYIQEHLDSSLVGNKAVTSPLQVIFHFKRFIQSRKFEYIVIFLVIGSSVTMALEDIHLHDKPTQLYIVQTLDMTFTVLFFIEMCLRWYALGINQYFTNAWNRFDFILVLLSLVEVFVINTFTLTDHSVDGMKSFRALRPLRLIPRWERLELVVRSLMLSLPAMCHVVLVVLFIWLPFAILGVHFFAGRFFQCVDGYQNPVRDPTIHNKTECIDKGYFWEEMFYNFNHIGNSYLALLQLAMFSGWKHLTSMMVDFNEEDLQPITNNQPRYYIFVVVFVILGSFFSLNLFVCVAVDTFRRSQRHVKMGDILLTDTQRKHYKALLKLANKRPVVYTNRPTNKILNVFYSVTYSLWCRVITLLLIFVNTLTIALNSFDDSPSKKQILHYFDLAFTTLYVVEFVIKILGLRKYYFLDFWNIFDLVLLVIHILGDIFLNHPSTESNPLSFLYALRLLRILRLLRLTNTLVDLRRLLHTMIMSIPALVNISLLLFLIIFVYSLLGMSLFGHIKFHGTISTKVNFQTFLHSSLLLFRLTTAQGWEEVLESLSLQPPYCDKAEGNCGNMVLAVIFLLSFILISNIILVNIFIAVILDNYVAAVMQENEVINDDNLADFYRLWKEYDPKATQFIPYSQLSDFLDKLNKAMRIPKPNHITIVHMNLPLTESNLIHCLNVLKGILEIKAGGVEDSATFQIVCDQVEKKYNKIFPKLKTTKFVETTMQLKRKEFAAKIIQANLKKMRNQKLQNKN